MAGDDDRKNRLYMYSARNGPERSKKKNRYTMKMSYSRRLKWRERGGRGLYETSCSQMSRQPNLSLHLRICGGLDLPIVSEPE